MAYTLISRKGDTVRFLPFKTGIIDKESESYNSSVTTNPVENGCDITDHINNDMGTLNISGIIIGGNNAINALKAMRESRDILTYTGVTRMSNLVFTSLKFDRSHKNKNWASFSATLKQIQTNVPEYIDKNAKESMVEQDNGKNTNSDLAKIVNTGMKTVALQQISASSAEKYEKAYTKSNSLAPLTRKTGGYNGIVWLSKRMW